MKEKKGKSDYFVSTDISFFSFPICNDCIHFNSKLNKCKAFPSGIPDSILNGDNDHKTPLKNQVGKTVFTKK